MLVLTDNGGCVYCLHLPSSIIYTCTPQWNALVHKRSEYKPRVPIALSELLPATACKRKIIYTQRVSRAIIALALQNHVNKFAMPGHSQEVFHKKVPFLPMNWCCYERRLYGWHSTAKKFENNSNSILKRMKRTSRDAHTRATILVYIKMALTKASASKGWRSSTPSPTPTNFTGIPSSSTTLTCQHKLFLSMITPPQKRIVLPIVKNHSKNY